MGTDLSGAGFHIVLSGSCRLLTPDGSQRTISNGDVVLTPHGAQHALESLGHADAEADSPTSLLCGAYQLDQTHPHPRVLPEARMASPSAAWSSRGPGRR
ncbi:cupin domain-containing protein [Streptomyces sp. 5-10]|uniref:cupin domain-containing protein n=1 Tax=Streptomyces sp. 5-10 TaxID=878925 RepID=UPI001CC31466